MITEIASSSNSFRDMTTGLQINRSNPPLTIRFYLTEGSVHEFMQADVRINERLWNEIEPSRLFARQRIIVGSEHSKSVFVASEIIRVDFVHESFQCWEFPAGYADIVELTEDEFRHHVHLDQRELMVKRNEPTPPGDLLVSFLKLQMRGVRPLFIMVEVPAKLPVENQFFMQFMLSKGAVHMRLRSGGMGVLNLANLAGFTVYPGVAQIPSDSWLAEPI
jgi:hypothetical protein